MKKKPIFFIVALLFLLGGCTEYSRLLAPESGDEAISLRENKPKTRSFKARISVDPVEEAANLAGFCDGQFGVFKLVEQGREPLSSNLTHLGKPSFVESTACVRPFILDDPEVFPRQLYGQLLPFLDIFPVPGEIDQRTRFVAANGKDELFMDYHFTSRPDPEDKFNSILEGTYTITGGSGKFEGATGSGAYLGSAATNFLAPDRPTEWELHGTITY